MSVTAWREGHVIAGKYCLEGEIGHGGMGRVWTARHVVLKSTLAIKSIDATVAHSAETLTRFLREAQAAAALRSPHVIHTFDYGVHDGVPYIAMELLEGETLATRLRRERVLDPVVVARILTHVARAVGKGHEMGVVHRDLKPDNIFIVPSEDGEVAKVLDFGIAKTMGEALPASSDVRTKTGTVIGTPSYMSPEQARGNQTVDFRTDLWSMGVIAFECLVGCRPFASDGLGDLLMQICAGPVPVPSEDAPVPEGFDAWFARALERDPGLRFQSARALAEALQGALGVSHAFAGAHPSSRPSAPDRSSQADSFAKTWVFSLRHRKQRAAHGLLGVAVVLLLAGLVWWALS